MNLKTVKSFFIACCLVFCLTSAAFCIDPYAVYKDGFGPKIKGLQLGMKKSLQDYVSWGINNKGLPFYLEITGSNGYALIYFTGEVTAQRLKNFSFKVPKITGLYSELKNQSLALEDFLNSLEKISPIEKLAYKLSERQEKFPTELSFNENGRINAICLNKSIFGADSLTVSKFVEAIVTAYNIPSINNINRVLWWYKEPSEGWEITIDRYELNLKPIINHTAFN